MCKVKPLKWETYNALGYSRAHTPLGRYIVTHGPNPFVISPFQSSPTKVTTVSGGIEFAEEEWATFILNQIEQ